MSRSLQLCAAVAVCLLACSALVAASNVDGAADPEARTSTLSHPGVITLPMTRNGGSLKATARANAGDSAYQRLLSAQRHGARLNAEERAMQTQATSKPIPLAGCPFADFTIPVKIGASTFQLLADTGSSTLAVAGKSCSNCNNVSPLWAQSATSTNQNAAALGEYGDATSWYGAIWKDKVSLADSTGTTVTAQASTRIAVITSQSQNGIDATGTANSNASPFFTQNPCSDISGKAILSQGIIGIAYQALASKGTDSFMSQLFATDSTLPQQFAIQMCENSGNMWIGGYDNSTFKGDLLYTPITEPLYYTVAPVDVYIGGQALGFTAQAWKSGVSIVDSGTTLWELPAAVYDAVVAAVLADPTFRANFRYAADNNFFNHIAGNCEVATVAKTDYATLQKNLPSISLKFANGLTLTMDGVGSYLLPCNNAYDQWTPGISSGDGMIGGWPLMNQFVVVHDVANSQVGFAVSSSCTTGKKPYNSSVLMGTPESGPASQVTPFAALIAVLIATLLVLQHRQ